MRLSIYHFMGFSIIYIHICMCVQFQNNMDINKEKEMCLSNKESIVGHRCERTNIAAT